MSKNCPNCGAVIELEHNKCPYCNTLYFDLSQIDFDNKTPIFLKIHYQGMDFIQKVIPQSCDIKIDSDFAYAYNGNQKITCITNKNIVANIDFIGVI